jgi:hypothetical protein
MPHGLQVVNFFKQGLTGGAFEPLAPGTGDSATFFNVPQGSPAYLGEIWGVDDDTTCELSLTASRFHDQVFGIREQIPAGSSLSPAGRASLISPAGLDQPIFPSDVLTVQANGTAGDNVNVTFVLYYQDIPGISARLATYDYVYGNMKNLVGIDTPLTAGTGDWGTGVALNASDNRLHANTDYAVLGFTSDLPCAAVGLSGIDTGNLRVGGPVLAEPEHDAYLFADFARKYNAALVPIINSNNAGSIVLQGADPTNTAIKLHVTLAELKAPFGGI